MEFVKGATFREWLSWPLRRKAGAVGGALISLAALVIFGTLYAVVFRFGGPWLKDQYIEWADHRAFTKLEGKQLQRRVDASQVTHEPYRFLIDKCVATEVQHIVKSTLFRCRGNVRVLAGNDQMLGRGDISFAHFSDDSKSLLYVNYGDLVDTFELDDLRDQ